MELSIKSRDRSVNRPIQLRQFTLRSRQRRHCMRSVDLRSVCSMRQRPGLVPSQL